MVDALTIAELRGLLLSASEIKALSKFEDAMVEDYLSFLDNLITIATTVNALIEETLEEIPTNFTNGSVPFAENNLLAEDNINLKWDNVNKKLTAFNVDTDKVCFDLTPTSVPPTEGEIAWNEDDGTLNIGLPGGDVVGQVLQELLTPRAKADGVDILNGQLVYVSGATGVNPDMSLAKADAVSTSAGTIAMATEDVASNTRGYFTAVGLVRDVNTNPATYTAGDQLYLSATTAGGYTNVKPTSPNYVVRVGIVMYAHITNGVIYVDIQNNSNLFTNIIGLTANSIPYADSNGFLTETNPGLTYNGTHLKIAADNAKVYSGAGDDASLYYDGTAHNIKTDEVAASDLNITCGANKTIELQNVVYDDWYFEIVPKTVGAGKPTLATFSGNINQWQMAINDITELRPVETAHKWKEGTELEIHVHWASNGVDGTDRGVKWEIDYTWANTLSDGGTTAFAAATTVSAEQQIPANTPDKTHIRNSIFSFTPTGGEVGACLLMSLKRITSVTDPTPSNDPWVLMVGVHYQIDTIGSRQIYIK